MLLQSLLIFDQFLELS